MYGMGMGMGPQANAAPQPLGAAPQTAAKKKDPLGGLAPFLLGGLGGGLLAGGDPRSLLSLGGIGLAAALLGGKKDKPAPAPPAAGLAGTLGQ